MKTYKSITRIVQILLIMSRCRGFLTVKDIKEKIESETELEIPLRTIQRDLEKLRDITDEIECVGEKFEGYRYRFKNQNLAKSFSRSLTPEQVLAGQIIKASSVSFKGTRILSDYTNLLGKLLTVLPTQDTKESLQGYNDVSTAIELLPFGTFNWQKQNKVFDNLLDAICKRKQISFYYTNKKDEYSNKIVAPKIITIHKGLPYLVGEEVTTNNLRIYSISRIENVRTVNKSAIFSAEFLEALKEYEEKRFGISNFDKISEKVVLKFEPFLKSQIINRMWHSSQNIIVNPDGSVTLTMKTAISEELISWILSWQSWVYVESPKLLSDTICNRAKSIITNYKNRNEG